MSLKTLLNVPPILSVLKQAYSVIDQDVNILWANNAFQELFDPFVLAQLKEALIPNPTATHTLKLFSKDSEPLYLELEFQAYAEIDQAAAAELYLCACRKVNKQEEIKSENELMEKQTELIRITDRFRLAAKAAGIGIWDYYPVENKLVWDEQTYSLYGVEEEEFGGAYEAWERHVHPEDKEKAVSELGKALSGEKEFNTEFRVVLSDGTIRHLSGVGSVIRNEQNEPIRMTGVNADITELKQHLDQLNLLQSVVETTLDSIIITKASLDGQEILYANPAHEQMTGYNLAEIKGKSPRIFQGPRTDKKELKRVREALEKGENVQSELLNYGKSGQEYWVNMIVTYVKDHSGSISHFVSVQRDVSNQKKNQQALLEAKEIAENASEAKSEFLSTMSHEIRTPLNAVIGMTGLLAETELNEEQEAYLHTIRNGGESLLSVINDILDYSKIEAGKIELEEEKFRLLDPVENTLDLLAGKANEKQIELMYHIEKPVPQFVRGDITRLGQILINLIGNAIKFTEGGEILVKVRQVEVKGEKVSLEFSIKDTGIGIPKEKVNRLFQSFSQVDASTTRKFGGTGLGLAISRKLIELQGGNIWVESEVGLGSTFFFKVVLGQIHETLEVDTSISALKGKRVLVVDDNQTNLSILQQQLSEVEMEVMTFTSPTKVLDYMDKEADHRPWDLCIIDFHMPEMDGSELGRTLRQIPAYKEIPLILLSSGYNGKDDSRKDIFKLILDKPIKKGNLIKQIAMILGPQTLEENLSSTRIKSPELDISEFNILLAEDNLINQRVAKKMLEKFHGNLEIANNGIEALELIQTRSFDLVLMDMQMPEMDGIQATRAIRQMDEIKQPLILAMTANVSEEDRKACIDAGMDDFISKPIKLEDLRETLRKWLLSVIT